jgi:RHS repeat-associated protein
VGRATAYAYDAPIAATMPVYACSFSVAFRNGYKFTGKERDTESGLDYFGARHYSSAMGRFMVPDWAAKPTSVPYANFGDPQSLNLYSYVRNHPISQTDPDGHTCADPITCGAEAGAGIGTLVEPGGGTVVGAIIGGIAGAVIGIYVGDAIVNHMHHSDNANKNAPPPPASSQSKSKAAQSTPADPNQGKSDKEGAQDKKLTKSEVKALEKNTGETAEEIKSGTMQSEKAGQFDLYKNSDGDIVAKPKGSSGAGEQTGYTIKDLKTKPD